MALRPESIPKSIPPLFQKPPDRVAFVVPGVADLNFFAVDFTFFALFNFFC